MPWAMPIVNGLSIALEHVCKEGRYLDGAYALLGFWTGYYILLVKSGVALVDVYFPAVKVNVFGRQSEGFTGAHSRPEQEIKKHVRVQLV